MFIYLFFYFYPSAICCKTSGAMCAFDTKGDDSSQIIAQFRRSSWTWCYTLGGGERMPVEGRCCKPGARMAFCTHLLKDPDVPPKAAFCHWCGGGGQDTDRLFYSARSVNVQVACHKTLGSPLLPPPSPLFASPKGTFTDNERGNAGIAPTQRGGVSINALQINKE